MRRVFGLVLMFGLAAGCLHEDVALVEANRFGPAPAYGRAPAGAYAVATSRRELPLLTPRERRALGPSGVVPGAGLEPRASSGYLVTTPSAPEPPPFQPHLAPALPYTARAAAPDPVPTPYQAAAPISRNGQPVYPGWEPPSPFVPPRLHRFPTATSGSSFTPADWSLAAAPMAANSGFAAAPAAPGMVIAASATGPADGQIPLSAGSIPYGSYIPRDLPPNNVMQVDFLSKESNLPRPLAAEDARRASEAARRAGNAGDVRPKSSTLPEGRMDLPVAPGPEAANNIPLPFAGGGEPPPERPKREEMQADSANPSITGREREKKNTPPPEQRRTGEGSVPGKRNDATKDAQRPPRTETPPLAPPPGKAPTPLPQEKIATPLPKQSIPAAPSKSKAGEFEGMEDLMSPPPPAKKK